MMAALMMSSPALAQNEAPKGKLIYCSYSCSRPAMGGKDYCELIADEGQKPRVVVSLYNSGRWHEPLQREFEVTALDVAKMQKLLVELQVWRINGYRHDEMLDGAPTYRIYQEYASGEKFDASWSGQDIDPDARDAYQYIAEYFSLWRELVDDREH